MPIPEQSKKSLFLGKCLDDLHRLSEVKPLASTVNNIIKSSDKVFKDAEKFDSQKDEERAFIMFMKYFNILKQVKARADYKKQKEFFDNLIGRKNQLTAIERAEKLSESLKQRYDLRDAEAAAKKIGAEVEKKSSVNETSNHKEKEISKSETPDAIVSSGSISCTQLCTLLRDRETKLILMDVRPATDFLQSHVSHTDCICVPEDILTPGSTVSHIEKKLTDESKIVWQNRKHVDHIIIIDWKSKSEDVKLGTPAKTLRDALFKFDTNVIIKSEPLVLDGGYEQWLLMYPTLTTNAHVSLPTVTLKNKPPSPTFTLNFDFPDVDDDGRKVIRSDDEKKVDSQPSVLHSSDSDSSQNSLLMNTNNPLIPRVDRSLKPSFSLSKISNIEPKVLNNAEVKPASNLHNDENRQEEPASDGDLYPKLISGVKHQNGPADKNVTSDAASPKNINLTFRNDLTSALSNSVKQRETEEANLKQFQVSRDGKLQEDQERIDQLQKQLQELELMKKREEKDVAELMRMKRKMKEELDLEKKQLHEDKQRFDAEEEEKLIIVQRARLEEEEKKRRLAEVEQLRTKRKQEEQNVARQKEEEEEAMEEAFEKATIRRQQEDLAEEVALRKQREDMAEEVALRKQREELAEADRKELERLRKEETIRKQYEAESAAEAQRKKTEEDERKHQEELKLKAKKEAEERKADELRKKEEKRLEEEMLKKKMQKEKEQEKLKQEQEERASAKAQESKASHSSPSKIAPAVAQLPPGWEKRLNKKANRYFYIDHNSGTTQWTPPTAAPSSAAMSATPSSSSSSSKQQDDTSVVKLREEPSMSSSRGLSRSHSSPNIMKQLADEEKARRSQQAIDRSIKPNISSNKPIVRQTAYSMRKRELNPVFGNVGSALTGLRNLGNTCYMNSTVQCLSNTSPLVSYFLNDAFLNDINRESDKGMRGEVVDEFAVVIKALWSGQYRSITPRDLKSTIGQYSPMFAGYDQQDSQEFLTFLLDGLHEGLNEVKGTRNIPEQNNDNLSDAQAAKLAWDHHKLLHRSFIVELFQGQLKSTLMCKTCRKTSTNFQPFMFLSLPIPKSSRCSLQSCIEEFLKPEMMTGSCKWKCTQCKIERDSEKKMDIWRLPPILLVGLNRFYSDGMWMQKKTTYVDFPVADLDLTPLTSGSSSRSRYSLYGISNHYGTMEGGHYTAFCRNPMTTRWYQYDDQDVREIPTSDIKTSAAFVLYYTSIPLQAPHYNPRL